MKPDSPYVGPRTFTEEERRLFFGRDREVEDLIHLLLAERIVLLHSPSGAGKSSLLQAGLIPQLKELGFLTKGPLRVNDCANFPWENFSKEPRGEVIIFDQFEETITVDPINVDAKKRFFQQLGRALHSKERWAVFAIREDYLAALDPYLNFIPTRLSNTFRLNLLGEKGAKDAICLPAENAGIPFSKEAADALFDDLRTIQIQLPDGGKDSAKGEFVEPVQLQVVCSRIWSDLPDDAREIGLGNIRIKKDGGKTDATNKDAANKDQASKDDPFSEVDRALADYYSVTVREVAKISEAVTKNITERDLRDWFEQHLITRQGIRSQVLRSEGLGEQISDGLIKAHVVRPETRSNRDFLELAHDRLIQPVLASNKEWRDANLSPFQQEAERWNENGERSPDRLLRGQALQQAEAWAKSNVPNATELEFLQASQRARRALWFGRVVTVVMGILLVTAVVSALMFKQERTSYLNALTAGRKMTRDLVFQIDDQLRHLSNASSVRKELLGKAIELNEKLGVTRRDEYEVAMTNWWAHKFEAEVAELDQKPDEAKMHYEHAEKVAFDLVRDYGDDPEAQHLLWQSYAALGDFNKKEGDQLKDEEKARARWNDASAFYQQALPIAVKLVNRAPKDQLLRFDLYLLYKGLGDTVEDSSEARKFYTHALDESTRLAQEYPNDETAQSCQLLSLLDLGSFNQQEGDKYQTNHDEENARSSWKDASALYRQALPLAQKLDPFEPQGDDANSHARHLEHRHNMVGIYMALGEVERDVHNKRNWYEKAQTLAEDTYNEEEKLLLGTAKSSLEKSKAKKDLDDAKQALRDLDRGTKK
jgi:hypothetical protein